MKALDKLREAAQLLEITDMRPSLYEIADEIECELAERYMLLPVDADGVPIHVGDVLEYDYDDDLRGTHTVRALIYDGTRRKEFDGGIWDFEFDDDDDGDDSRSVNCMSDFYECNRHYHAPTVEDVLEEFAELPERIDRIVAIPRIADKLREVMGDE